MYKAKSFNTIYFCLTKNPQNMDKKPFKSALLAGLLAVAPAGRALDVHLQELPPAPGLRPSAALDPLEGLRETLSCGLDFLDTAKACGLSAPQETASPFLVRFDPMFCRLTMRFSVGELIDGLLKQWIAGALARIGSPAVGALCLLGIGPQFCGASELAAPAAGALAPAGALRAGVPTATAERRRAPREAPKAAQTPGEREIAPQPQPETTGRETGLDHLVR